MLALCNPVLADETLKDYQIKEDTKIIELPNDSSKSADEITKEMKENITQYSVSENTDTILIDAETDEMLLVTPSEPEIKETLVDHKSSLEKSYTATTKYDMYTLTPKASGTSTDSDYDATYAAFATVTTHFSKEPWQTNSSMYRIDRVWTDFTMHDTQCWFTRAEVGYRSKGKTPSNSYIDDGESKLIANAAHGGSSNLYRSKNIWITYNGMGAALLRGSFYGTIVRGSGGVWDLIVHASVPVTF